MNLSNNKEIKQKKCNKYQLTMYFNNQNLKIKNK